MAETSSFEGAINKKEHEITYDQEGILFSIKSGKTNVPSLVTYQDIFAVGNDSGPVGAVITIHHAGKKKAPVWTHDELSISIKDAEVGIKFANYVKQEIQKHGKRPHNCLIFINPDGGDKKGVKLWTDTVEPMFKLAGINVDVVVTENGEHSGEVINNYDLGKVDSILSMGGDGSFGMIVNRLLLRIAKDEGKDVNDSEMEWSKPTQRIGVIASGSGMGANKALAGAMDLVTGVLYILLGRTCKHHLGAVYEQGGKFISTSSVLMSYGMIADFHHWTESKRKYGKARFLLGLFRLITVSFPEYDVELSYDLPNAKGESGTEWVTETGRYANIGMVAFPQLYWRRPRHPSYLLNNIHAGFPKFRFFKHIGRMQAQRPDMADFEGMDTMFVRSYKMKMFGKGSPYLSIDGEPVEFTGDTILVRFLGESLDMYGDMDVLLDTKADEVKELEETRAENRESNII